MSPKLLEDSSILLSDSLKRSGDGWNTTTHNATISQSKGGLFTERKRSVPRKDRFNSTISSAGAKVIDT